MLLAPPGSRYIPSDQDSLKDLKDMGWFFASVHSCCEKNVTMIAKGIRATRVQYKLRRTTLGQPFIPSWDRLCPN